MKKYILSAAVIAMLASACEPMEDINKEIDAEKDGKEQLIQKNITREALPEMGTYSLVEDDYKTMGTEYGEPGKFNNFSDDIDPTAFIPEFLYEKFVIMDKEATLKVSYNYYTPSVYTDSEVTPYVMTEADYDFLGTDKYQPGDRDRFSASDKIKPAQYIQILLRNNFTKALEGAEMLVQYKLYERFNEDRKQEYSYDGTAWVLTDKTDKFEDAYKLLDEDYVAMGDNIGKYKNFSSYDEAEDNLPAFLLTKFPNAVAGDKQVIQYKYTFTKVSPKASHFTFKGTVWVETGNVTAEKIEGSEEWTITKKVPGSTEVVTVDYTFTPGAKDSNEGVWKPDPSVKLELTNEDYAVTGDDKYKNFYVKGKVESDVVLEKVGQILDANYASKVKAGIIFTVTYKYYDGSNGVHVIRVTKVGDKWEIASEQE